MSALLPDYAQAVLSKYPDAGAQLWPDGKWTIMARKLALQLSKPTKDRDAAWRDAYERLTKSGG